MSSGTRQVVEVGIEIYISYTVEIPFLNVTQLSLGEVQVLSFHPMAPMGSSMVDVNV